MLPSRCPLDNKVFDFYECRESCRYYDGVLNMQLVCRANPGLMEVTPYNLNQEPGGTRFEATLAEEDIDFADG